MNTPARIWATVGRALSVYGQRLNLFLGLAVIGNGATLAINTWTGWQSRASTTTGPTAAPMALLIVAFNIAGIALNVWSIVATYLATESALQQRSMSLGGALGAVRGKFWRYIGVSLLFGLIVLGGSLLLVIPGIYWAISFSLFGVVIALEARGAVGPLRRSRHVVTGAWWRTFGLGWAIGLLYLPVIALYLLSVRQGGATGNPAITHWGLYLLAQGLVLVLSPVTHIISVIWYHALKARQGAATAVTT